MAGHIVAHMANSTYEEMVRVIPYWDLHNG